MGRNTIEQCRYAGQNSAVRFFDHNDPVDIQRLRAIVESPAAKDWVLGDEMSDEELTRWAGQIGEYQEVILLAITGVKGNVVDGEVGEVQGFVNFYPPSAIGIMEALVKGGVIKAGKKVVEVSYAKNPCAKPGQMDSGLVQGCFVVNRLRGDYFADGPSLDIVAFIDRLNVASIRMIERAGFERKSDMDYNDGGKIEVNSCFKLNWQKAQRILHVRAGELLWKSKSRIF